MTVFLLALLNVQLSAIVGWAILERREALQYREKAREHLGSIDDSALAAWARLAGKTRLEQAGNRDGAVLASRRNQHEESAEPGRGESIEEVLHPSMMASRADSV